MNQIKLGAAIAALAAVAVVAGCSGDRAAVHSGAPHMARAQVSGIVGQPAVPPVLAQAEIYAASENNPVRATRAEPVSTFSIDVDTASYANVRRFLNHGRLPPAEAVRVEEMVNYFTYDDEAPKTPEAPFKVTTEVAPSPWNADALLMRIAVKAYEVERSERPPANLVFLVDVSGSMGAPDKLPLLKSAFKLLTDRMTSDDRVAMVVYAGAAGVVLDPVSGDQKADIRAALDRLSAGGSTNGGAGIEMAYALARESFIEGGINRVILATDGDMNVGVADFDGLLKMIKHQRASGISLTTLGFGQGNINDRLLEQLADNGNGNYAYIDSLSEARKVLVQELSATLMTVASDVKVQVEFNPATVAEYRLIGYENRLLGEADFANDKVDAGEIGAGHSVTALYEIALPGSSGLGLEPRRYGDASAPEMTPGAFEDELAFVKLRYKLPGQTRSVKTSFPVLGESVLARFADASPSMQFAASVAAFAQILKDSPHTGAMTLSQVADLARHARGDDPEGYRAEFLRLVDLAKGLGAGMAER